MDGGDPVLSDKIPSEHYEQVRFVGKFRIAYPGVRIFAIPNGGHRGKLTATKLKNEGVSKGVPDLFIPEWRLWIEMKRQKGGTLSPEQKDWRDYLIGCGYRWILAKGAADAINQVAEIIQPSK